MKAPDHVDFQQDKLKRGFKWSFATTAIQGVLQVVVTMIMARLLMPSDYGLYALVEVVIRWGNLICGTGLATVLVQRQLMQPDDWKAARAMSWTYSFGITLLVMAAAPLIAAGFGNPEVTSLLRLAALSFIINGVGLAAVATLRRNLQFGLLGTAELSGYILGNGLTAILLAQHGAGAWSVAIGTLVGVLVQNCTALALTRPPPGFMIRGETFLGLVKQSFHVSTNSVLDMCNNTMDTVVIGRVAPQTVLGYYNRALMLATLPTYFLWNAVNKVALPGYASLQHRPGAFIPFFKKTKLWSGTLSVAVPMAMIPAAEPIVAFLLGEKWLTIVPILRPLLLAFAFESLAVPYHSAIDALGRYGCRSKIRIVTLLARAGLLAAAVYLHQPSLFWVAACVGFLTWIISSFPLAGILGLPLLEFYREDLLIIFRALACTAAVALAYFLIGNRSWIPFISTGICALAGALPLLWVFRRQLSAMVGRRF